MTAVTYLTNNPFQENTYILYDETKECIIIDPGCFYGHEKEALVGYIQQHDLKPVRLINTHCHIDHVFGNKFVADTYGLGLEIHQGELVVLQAIPQVAQMYGIPYKEPSPEPTRYIAAGELIEFGNTKLEARFTPGHSPASLSFYCAESGFIIGGDVLFQGSIGRTDLPGGNMATLLKSIETHFLSLDDDTLVYSGHGNSTTIGAERQSNPFLTQAF